ncbi:MAG TPA: MFS transporter [Xanthobacteraceae bacterium]|jgi:EmrB/QacA subfamily drug resistance transporter|nr:MFS transporter [Xanthobacteraceae bacterium]
MNDSLNRPEAADRSAKGPAAAPERSPGPEQGTGQDGSGQTPPQNSATEPEDTALSARAQFLLVFPPIMLPMFLAVADQTIVATALPAIASSLGEIERASWVVVSYLIANTIAAPVYGRLGDTFGRRSMMFVALSIFMIGSILCAVAPNITLLTLFRVIQGFGGGGLMTLSQALIGEAIPPRERGRYQGYLAGIAVTSNSFGPVAGGYLTQAFGWPSIFLVNIPLGLLAMLFVIRIPGRQGDRRRTTFDSPGLVLFIFFVGPVILALEQVQRMQLSAMPIALGLLAFGLVSLVLLAWQERLTTSPLIPPKLFRQPSIWRCDAMAAFHGAALVSLITFLPIYLRAVRDLSPAETGFMLLPMTAGIGIGSMMTGQLVTRTGHTATFPTYGLIGATISLALLAFFIPYLSALQIAWAFGGVALFMGTVMGVVQVTVQTVSGPRLLGTGAAMVQFSRSVGAAFGTATVSAVLFSFLTVTDRDTATLFGMIIERGPDALATLDPVRQALVHREISDAFHAAFLTVACFTAVGAWMAWTMPMRRI